MELEPSSARLEGYLANPNDMVYWDIKKNPR